MYKYSKRLISELCETSPKADSIDSTDIPIPIIPRQSRLKVVAKTVKRFLYFSFLHSLTLFDKSVMTSALNNKLPFVMPMQWFLNDKIKAVQLI